MDEELLFERQGGAAVVTLNRPDRRNALTDSVCTQLLDVLRRVDEDDSYRCLVLRGTGDVFCSGFDLTHRKRPLTTPEQWRVHADLVIEMLEGIWDLRVPTVAVVRGYALGGGLELAAVCDFTLATPDAQFGSPAVRFGIGGLGCMIPWVLPMKVTKRLLLTGERITAAEGLAYGLVTSVHEEAELDVAVEQLCERLSTIPPFAAAMAKEWLNRAFEGQGMGTYLGATRDWFVTTQLADREDREQFRALAKAEGFGRAIAWYEELQRDRLQEAVEGAAP